MTLVPFLQESKVLVNRNSINYEELTVKRQTGNHQKVPILYEKYIRLIVIVNVSTCIHRLSRRTYNSWKKQQTYYVPAQVSPWTTYGIVSGVVILVTK
jgi:hypothetical protein